VLIAVIFRHIFQTGDSSFLCHAEIEFWAISPALISGQKKVPRPTLNFRFGREKPSDNDDDRSPLNYDIKWPSLDVAS
jgi:hypothetical protein